MLLTDGEMMLGKDKRRACCYLGVWLFGAMAVSTAVASQAPSTSTPPASANSELVPAKKELAAAKRRRQDEAASPRQAVPAPAPAEPARIILRDGILTIHANNSDLRGILQQVASVSGMFVEGSVASAPVYGIYGPGNPREVLTTLLSGAGYNFVMTGLAQQGAPRELQITLQSASAPSASDAQLKADSSGFANTSQAGTDRNTSQEEPGPGAIVNVPPPPSDDPQERVQQNLRRLQQMRDPDQGQQSQPQ